MDVVFDTSMKFINHVNNGFIYVVLLNKNEKQINRENQREGHLLLFSLIQWHASIDLKVFNDNMLSSIMMIELEVMMSIVFLTTVKDEC